MRHPIRGLAAIKAAIRASIRGQASISVLAGV
jgi:hypothetical protein